MADEVLQLVTFQLGEEQYGVDIMDVDGIVKPEEVRPIPSAPAYVEGIFNLRGAIIPVINLHRRFHIARARLDDSDRLLSGFVILSVNEMQLAVIIDKVSRVVRVKRAEMQPPPQVFSGIGAEYIEGVISRSEGYLIVLDVAKLFSARELQQLSSVGE